MTAPLWVSGRASVQWLRHACAALTLGVALAVTAEAQQPQGNRDPDRVRLVYDGLRNFERTHALLSQAPRTKWETIIEREYFKPASAGLRGWIPNRLPEPAALAAALDAYPRYYESILPRLELIHSINRVPCVTRHRLSGRSWRKGVRTSLES